MFKKILVAILICALIGVGTGIYLWNKPHKKAEDIQGIRITATALAQDYKADEKTADTKYLNKVIEVSGTIDEVDKNQDGGTMVVLQTGDPMAGVQCSMREKNVNPAKGQQTTIKGFCSGNGITGVTLTDCVSK
jgi:hypothetical protein